ncbi:MAG TPA: VOC family protein [Chitinophaga sp.]|uniref:VOC family protein n=1 Tax=Chitinophaga sp. TaxID=1869181 RepID=UPI002CECEA33|nr:VOC family protein [Chitinophaga sp.]HVI47919.1 VOC family protein [Chitinophaga sp.]
MTLNHINLPVRDVPAARSFFEAYFNFTPADSKPNDTLAVMNGKDDFVLVLMNQRLNENGNHGYPDAFHIGFFLSAETEVQALYNRLIQDGHTLEQQPQRIRRTFGFYFKYEAFMIEIACPVAN